MLNDLLQEDQTDEDVLRLLMSFLHRHGMTTALRCCGEAGAFFFEQEPSLPFASNRWISRTNTQWSAGEKTIGGAMKVTTR